MKMPDSSIVKQSLQISIELYNSGQNSFYLNLMKVSQYLNLLDFNYNSSESKIKQLVDLMHEKEVCLLLERDASALM